MLRESKSRGWSVRWRTGPALLPALVGWESSGSPGQPFACPGCLPIKPASDDVVGRGVTHGWASTSVWAARLFLMRLTHTGQRRCPQQFSLPSSSYNWETEALRSKAIFFSYVGWEWWFNTNKTPTRCLLGIIKIPVEIYRGLVPGVIIKSVAKLKTDDIGFDNPGYVSFFNVSVSKAC